MEDVRHYGFEVRRLDHVFARNLEAKVREKGIDELTLMHGWIIRYLIDRKDETINICEMKYREALLNWKIYRDKYFTADGKKRTDQKRSCT